jgi:hypothetical protein
LQNKRLACVSDEELRCGACNEPVRLIALFPLFKDKTTDEVVYGCERCGIEYRRYFTRGETVPIPRALSLPPRASSPQRTQYVSPSR